MFTVCPGCTRQFRISAEHLAAASGQVRCGFCHEQFNALNRLLDEPLSNEKNLNEIQSEEPQFDIPAAAEKQTDVPESDVVISNTNTDIHQELETAINEIGIQPTGKIDQKSTINSDEVLEIPRNKPQYEFKDNEELLIETGNKKSLIVSVFWTIAMFFSLLFLLLQLAWFNRDHVLLKYPQLTPYVKQLCHKLDCSLIRQRDASLITLVNRDVRLHPRFKDTLLVNATMKNEMSIRQPYPKVQLTLYDTAGSLIGYRNFSPAEYLDNSIDIDNGMPVGSPVHFVLEVSGPTTDAVSFEFRFL